MCAKLKAKLLHTLAANIGVKDIRVNELNAYVLPEATTLFPGDEFRSHIFMAAVDTTQRPEIYVNWSSHRCGRTLQLPRGCTR